MVSTRKRFGFRAMLTVRGSPTFRAPMREPVIKQRLEFLNGERAVGIEDGVDAGHLGSDDAGRGRGRAKRTGRIGIEDCT